MSIRTEEQRELSRTERKKGESCSLECSCVFVNIINHRLADGDANCTCGNNMTQRILLFTGFNWHFREACHERGGEKTVNKLGLKAPHCHHFPPMPIKHTHAYGIHAISSSTYCTTPHLKCYCTLRDTTSLQTHILNIRLSTPATHLRHVT